MQRKHARLAALGLAALALVAAACGDEGSAAPTDTTPSRTAAESVLASTVAPTTVPTTTTAAATFDDPSLALDAGGNPATTVPPAPTSADPFVPRTGLPTPVKPPPERASERTKAIGRLDIPKLGISVDIYEGITLNTLDRGPGHWPGTAMPGQPGNVVVAGHRVSHSRPFRYIDRLVAGDRFAFTIDGVVSTYEVTEHFIVPPTGVHIVAQTPEPTATLFACHPPGSTRYRWVVKARLVTG
ncbi:MAG TPA: class E sortase [Acidimicrobiales bacterium]